MTTLKEVKQGKTLPSPIYVNDPYIILGRENNVLIADTLESILNPDNIYTSGTYYDNCTIEVRQYDLYLNDNTKINETKVKINHPLENGTRVIIDNDKKSEGVIIGKCTYTPDWAHECEQDGYIVESKDYDSVIVVHVTSIIGIKES